MKKTIAILLSCIMLLACIPLTASAADVTWSGVQVKSAPETINAGTTVIITGTYTVTSTLTVMEGASIIVQDGGSLMFTGDTGRLINSGTVTAKRNGTITFNGIGTGNQGATFVNNEKGVLILDNGSLVSLSKNSQGFNYGW